jgi:hypothetical protein
MSNLPKVNLNKLNELHAESGMGLLYHFLRNEPSQYMFEDFQSILIFNEVKNGNNEEQHNNIKTMLMGNNGF